MSNNNNPKDNVIDLLSSSDDETTAPSPASRIRNPYQKSDKAKRPAPQRAANDDDKRIYGKDFPEKKRQRPRGVSNELPQNTQSNTTSAFVLEEDLQQLDPEDPEDPVVTFRQVQALRRANQQSPQLYQDEAFPCQPASIRGSKTVVKEQAQGLDKAPSCRCRGGGKAKLSFVQNNPQRPIYSCKKCNYFRHALTAERLHWYRFGKHSGHVLVRSQFRAQDLSQGKVGDCWFLSALAVIAERPDLIQRLFPQTELGTDGVVQVRLFLDGSWKIVTVDNFLPCMVHDDQEQDLQTALQASLGHSMRIRKPHTFTATSSTSSIGDPFALADACRTTLQGTQEYLERQYRRITGRAAPFRATGQLQLQRPVTSADLAYSKAANQQLWVPFLEKAYAKSHGCYQGISGGHIAEAFLDLTGAPTAVHHLHTDPNFDAKSFWYRLLQYRRQRLPMGCGTSSSAAGIVGMHAYSILDVQEVKNVDFRFFQETGVAHGNVSGFTDYDGTVRLLRIRNPHGKGEWKGDFSDRSETWEKLLQHSGNSNLLERTMRNDGQFWIDYDNFLMAFTNVDVVLSFLGNNGKSFASNFPAKKSNHRCARAFEVSLVDDQLGVPPKNTVEIYVMGIQKTRRGARQGRTDRRVSYKVCDLGMLVGEGYNQHEKGGNGRFARVSGQMFGFNRNGHKRLILDRSTVSKLVIMPISFGHPAATDKELPFVLRFVSDAPLIIRELDCVPRMDAVIEQFCLGPMSPVTRQGMHRVLLEDSLSRIFQVDCRESSGGIVLLYMCINETELRKQGLASEGISVSFQANCRGMSARTEKGLLLHETIAKGKKFEAAWRRYSADFVGETKSRLLLVLYQSGQDTEFGAITCRRVEKSQKLGSYASEKPLDDFVGVSPKDEYYGRGIFNPPKDSQAYALSGSLETKDAPAMYGDAHDEQLELALAESRNDTMFQQALDRSMQQGGSAARASNTGGDDILESVSVESRGDATLQQALQQSLERSRSVAAQTVGTFDADLQNALELSKIQSRGAAHPCMLSQSGSVPSGSGTYNDALSVAIKLSLESQRDEQPASSNLGSDSGQAPIDLTGEAQAKSIKRWKTDCDAVVEDKKPADLAEKRRLVAEAAMKRFDRR